MGHNNDVPLVLHPYSGALKCKSAGVLVRNRTGEYLLLDRRTGLQAWAAPAGHLDTGEDPLVCILRELEEETGVRIKRSALRELFRCDAISPCSRGIREHGWFVFNGGVVSDDRLQLREPEKHRGIGWFSPREIRYLTLEPVWRAFFEKLGVIERV